MSEAGADAEIKKLYMEAAHDFILTPEFRAVMREGAKEGVKEWLQETQRAVGRWTIAGMAAAVVAALIYFVLWPQGWRQH